MRQNIKISKEDQDKKVVESIPIPDKVPEVVIEKDEKVARIYYLSKGDIEFVFTETRKTVRKYADGKESIITINPKRLTFRNRTADTEDEETTQAARRNAFFGKDFYYHPRYVPSNCNFFWKIAEAQYRKDKDLNGQGLNAAHMKGVQKRAYDMSVELANQFFREKVDHAHEIARMRENALEHSKDAHPEEGIQQLRDPNSDDPPEIAAW